jgi:hypothetical protein
LRPKIGRARDAVATSAEACDASGVTSDRRAPPTFSEAELPAVTPLEFVVGAGDGGQPVLDIRESEYEQGYNLRDSYSCSMFIALCRQEGLMVYRRPRQRTVTVCVKTTVSKHNALWARFLVLSDRLEAQLGSATELFVIEHVVGGKR